MERRLQWNIQNYYVDLLLLLLLLLSAVRQVCLYIDWNLRLTSSSAWNLTKWYRTQKPSFSTNFPVIVELVRLLCPDPNRPIVATGTGAPSNEAERFMNISLMRQRTANGYIIVPQPQFNCITSTLYVLALKIDSSICTDDGCIEEKDTNVYRLLWFSFYSWQTHSHSLTMAQDYSIFRTRCDWNVIDLTFIWKNCHFKGDRVESRTYLFRFNGRIWSGSSELSPFFQF